MKEIKIGLLGLGTVGKGVVEILEKNGDVIAKRVGAKLKVTRASLRNLTPEREKEFEGITLTTDSTQVTGDAGIDVVVEVMGGYDPAKGHLLDAINSGKHVVTANKALIAKHGREIIEAVNKKGIDLGFEASVAGGIPIIRALREGISANRVKSIYGIVNGTCNYILTKMGDEGRDFQDVLKEAQELGYAEADPTFDIEGIDSAHKIAILAFIAYGGYFDFEVISTEGITAITAEDIEYAHELGFKIKLLAIAKEADGKVDVRVHPTMIRESNPLASVNGVLNAVELTGDMVGETFYVGPGAGALPTASAVVGDLIEIGRNMVNGGVGRVNPLSWLTEGLGDIELQKTEDIESAYYLRFSVIDEPGVLSKIAGILGENSISITSVIQKELSHEEGEGVPLVIMVHRSKEKNLKKAIAEIDKLDLVLTKTAIIRVEEEA